MSSSTQELRIATTELPGSAAVAIQWLALAVLLTGALHFKTDRASFLRTAMGEP